MIKKGKKESSTWRKGLCHFSDGCLIINVVIVYIYPDDSHIVSKTSMTCLPGY